LRILRIKSVLTVLGPISRNSGQVSRISLIHGFRARIQGFHVGFKEFQACRFKEFNGFHVGFQGFYVGFQGFQAGFQRFSRSDFTDYRDFRDCRNFRLDFGDFRSDFRTFVNRISEVVGLSVIEAKSLISS